MHPERAFFSRNALNTERLSCCFDDSTGEISPRQVEANSAIAPQLLTALAGIGPDTHDQLYYTALKATGSLSAWAADHPEKVPEIWGLLIQAIQARKHIGSVVGRTKYLCRTCRAAVAPHLADLKAVRFHLRRSWPCPTFTSPGVTSFVMTPARRFLTPPPTHPQFPHPPTPAQLFDNADSLGIKKRRLRCSTCSRAPHVSWPTCRLTKSPGRWRP